MVRLVRSAFESVPSALFMLRISFARLFSDVVMSHSGDVVFFEWKANYLLHLVVGIEPERVLFGGAGFGKTR